MRYEVIGDYKTGEVKNHIVIHYSLCDARKNADNMIASGLYTNVRVFDEKAGRIIYQQK